MIHTPPGHYQIKEEVGKDSIRFVYKARDTHLDA
jgi:hypothetical protein